MVSALVALKVQSFMEDKQIYKVIVVPERLVNIVCGQIQRTLIPPTP
jgi:leucyl-tRNA synthetase